VGSTPPLIEMSTMGISWRGGEGGGERCAGLTALPLSCADCLETLGTFTFYMLCMAGVGTITAYKP